MERDNRANRSTPETRERAVRELRQANEILTEAGQESVRGTFSPTQAGAHFAQAELDRRGLTPLKR